MTEANRTENHQLNAGQSRTIKALRGKIAEKKAEIDNLRATLKYARECIAYCRRQHPSIQSGDGIPVEAIIDATLGCHP